jgi:glycosyltransferase involved in cell wall biosynthesis
MRVLIVDTYYPRFLDEHYAGNALAQASYDEQLTALMDRSFGTSDVYSTELRALGHEAWDVVVNAAPLQAAWARENGMRSAGLLAQAARMPTRAGLAARRAFQHRVALEQIQQHRPDVLYCQDLSFFSPRELAAIRARGALVVGQIASPAPTEEVLRGYGLICTSFPHFVERFRSIGVATEYLPIGFDARVVDRLAARGVDCMNQEGRDIDLSFIGSVNPHVHPARVALLEELCRQRPIEIHGNGVDALPADSPIREHFVGEAWGLDMYELLARSRVTVNRHIDAAEGYSNNMRLYEATGAGAMLLTDLGSNLSEIFHNGKEVVVYGTVDDLITAVDAYIDDEPLRAEVARSGQARTLGQHSYSGVIGELAQILEARLPSS